MLAGSTDQVPQPASRVVFRTGCRATTGCTTTTHISTATTWLPDCEMCYTVAPSGAKQAQQHHTMLLLCSVKQCSTVTCSEEQEERYSKRVLKQSVHTCRSIPDCLILRGCSQSVLAAVHSYRAPGHGMDISCVVPERVQQGLLVGGPHQERATLTT